MGQTSPKDSMSNATLFLSQQQQTLSNLIGAANGSITSQLNGLVDLDKKVWISNSYVLFFILT
jgi:hypothetical protein